MIVTILSITYSPIEAHKLLGNVVHDFLYPVYEFTFILVPFKFYSK
jgi:hypothetical protein